jgi:hypothetical protein
MLSYRDYPYSRCPLCPSVSVPNGAYLLSLCNGQELGVKQRPRVWSTNSQLKDGPSLQNITYADLWSKFHALSV